MKFKKILSTILSMTVLMLVPTNVHAEITGDVNGDNVFNVRDVAFLANSIALGKNVGLNGDYNNDGVVNVRDVASMAKAISDMYIYELMLKRVNQARTEVGASPLKLNTIICEMGSVRAKEITTVFSHDRPNGTDFFTIFKDFGINTYSACGENIAAGQTSVNEVMNDWINSSGHYKNIINNNYTELGVGYYYDPSSPYKHYWVQLFYSK